MPAACGLPRDACDCGGPKWHHPKLRRFGDAISAEANGLRGRDEHIDRARFAGKRPGGQRERRNELNHREMKAPGIHGALDHCAGRRSGVIRSHRGSPGPPSGAD
jgi:hypothetical protein